MYKGDSEESRWVKGCTERCSWSGVKGVEGEEGNEEKEGEKR